MATGPVPIPSSASVSARMSRQRTRDTLPEMTLRRALHGSGVRFRVDYPLPGMPRRRADLVFTRARLAVFVDGCFWHGCPQHATYPHVNEEWWRTKLARNVERDRETDARLVEQGWTILRFWEHDDMLAAADAVVDLRKQLLVRQGGGPTTKSPDDQERPDPADADPM